MWSKHKLHLCGANTQIQKKLFITCSLYLVFIGIGGSNCENYECNDFTISIKFLLQSVKSYITFQIRTRKLVNAKYCDRFPVVRWRDGKVVHVQVTPELHRNYEQKMLVALRAVQNRYIVLCNRAKFKCHESCSDDYHPRMAPAKNFS